MLTQETYQIVMALVHLQNDLITTNHYLVTMKSFLPLLRCLLILKFKLKQQNLSTDYYRLSEKYLLYNKWESASCNK